MNITVLVIGIIVALILLLVIAKIIKSCLPIIGPKTGFTPEVILPNTYLCIVYKEIWVYFRSK